LNGYQSLKKKILKSCREKGKYLFYMLDKTRSFRFKIHEGRSKIDVKQKVFNSESFHVSLALLETSVGEQG